MCRQMDCIRTHACSLAVIRQGWSNNVCVLRGGGCVGGAVLVCAKCCEWVPSTGTAARQYTLVDNCVDTTMLLVTNLGEHVCEYCVHSIQTHMC